MEMTFKPTPTVHCLNNSRQSFSFPEMCKRTPGPYVLTEALTKSQKKQFIWLGSQINLQKVIEHNIDLFGNILNEPHRVCNLGVILDLQITLSEHISRICRLCFFQLRNLRCMHKSIPRSSVLQLVHALVTCQLDYCNSIFHGLLAIQIRL